MLGQSPSPALPRARAAHADDRFTSKYNTIIVQMFRPSPQIPHPSVRAATLCFDASAYNLRMQRQQIADGSVDITWILVLTLFMALNTLLWSISYPEVRRKNPKSSLVDLLQLGLESIRLCADRWPGAASAHDLYDKLAQVRLKVYDEVSAGPGSTSPAPELASPTSLLVSAHPSASSDSPPDCKVQPSPPVASNQHSPSSFIYTQQSPDPSIHTFTSAPSPSYPVGKNGPVFADPSLQTLFPPADLASWESLYATPPSAPTTLSFGPGTAAVPTASSNLLSLSSGQFESPQIMYQAAAPASAPQTAMSPLAPLQESLSCAQQLELMDKLEKDGPKDISTLLDQSKSFFALLGTP